LAGGYSTSAWVYVGTLLEDAPAESHPDQPDRPPVRRTSSGSSTISEKDFRKGYQTVSHRMVHRKARSEMFRRLQNKTFESDGTVTVQRVAGEFGFRIHGSRPVVVSAIEAGTPVETSGLQCGDVLISLNGVNVLDSSHSEVVKIAHSGSDSLVMEIARTADLFLKPEALTKEVCSGYLKRRLICKSLLPRVETPPPDDSCLEFIQNP
ncbi:unnamed protein product, partial [Cyprideis torosa]